MATFIARLILLIAGLVVLSPAVSAQNLRERKLQTPALTTTGTVIPFGNCEGSCTGDNECQNGLVCSKDQFSITKSVPGCSGTREPLPSPFPGFGFSVGSSNYCITAPQGRLVIQGNDGNANDATGPFPLGECEGDCDSNDECGDGLLCFFRNGLEPVPGCSGTGVSGRDYCYVGTLGLVIVGENGIGDSFPLGECEGDCDTDEECGEGLLCFERDGTEAVPGCSGTGVSGKDYCFKTDMTRAPSTSSPTISPKPTDIPTTAPPSKAPTTSQPSTARPTNQPSTARPTRSPLAVQSLTITGTSFPLGNCEGSCFKDADCDNGLVCFKDPNASSAPGCSGTRQPTNNVAGSFRINYCVVAAPGQLVIVGENDIGPSFPLGECEGDCDTDEECGDGLLCFERDGTEAVPGCSGTGVSGKDYCFKTDMTRAPSTSSPTGSPTTSSPTVTAYPTFIPTTAHPSEAPTNPVPTQQPTTSRPSRSPIALEVLTTTDTVAPFGNCEGSCARDADCQNGLVCFDGISLKIPGCTGPRPFFSQFCIVPPPGRLVIRGKDGTGPSFPLGDCEGDCDTDDDCGTGLLCFSRDKGSTQAVPGCSGTGVSGANYCFRSSSDRPTRSPSTTVEPTSSPSTSSTPTIVPVTAEPSPAPKLANLTVIASGPFGNCEGSCNNDSECELGLNCYKPAEGFSGLSFVPSCSGFNFNGDNFCITPPVGTLVIAGRDDAPVSAFPLGICEGVCASDDDCEGLSECISRVSTEVVRGCKGAGTPGVSYCSNPLALTISGDDGLPESVFPLGLCEGDCDDDSECGDGLVCFERNRFDSIPGCVGAGAFDKDYCILATLAPEPAATPPAPTPPTGFPAFTGFPGFSGFFQSAPAPAPTPPTGFFDLSLFGFP
jgi:hypothetical protein